MRSSARIRRASGSRRNARSAPTGSISGSRTVSCPDVDPRATPACVNACIADALHFGDVDDPNSNVSRLLREQRSFRMHEELGTEPGFYYLYGKANGPN